MAVTVPKSIDVAEITVQVAAIVMDTFSVPVAVAAIAAGAAAAQTAASPKIGYFKAVLLLASSLLENGR